MDGKLKIRRKGVFKLDVHSGFYSFHDQNFCSKKGCAHYINESSTGSVSTILFAAKFSYTSKQLPNKLVFQKKFNNFLLWNLKKYPHTIILFSSSRLSPTKLLDFLEKHATSEVFSFDLKFSMSEIIENLKKIVEIIVKGDYVSGFVRLL